MTSAPNSASVLAAVGPASTCVVSTTRKPSSADARRLATVFSRMMGGRPEASKSARLSVPSGVRGSGTVLVKPCNRTAGPGCSMLPYSGSSTRTTMPASCACSDPIHSALVRIRVSGKSPCVASRSHSSAVRVRKRALRSCRCRAQSSLSWTRRSGCEVALRRPVIQCASRLEKAMHKAWCG